MEHSNTPHQLSDMEISSDQPRTIRFKKLELQGFKSFPDRTALEFNDDICAIVGPNGCGKSNILDAIRWVLGEQGPSQLRARAMADIIFNGAAGRRPVGMSEITLTIEAPAGSLPLSFQEVEITRRLYRSGDSEYLINRTACRLRDITDLFLDTGMGKGAYSLIEQGRVDALVTARPEDRRAFLEQTAGIEKYKVRKKEALSKLNSTEHNLARVQDVVAEVRSRRISLSRQARKAAKYRTIKNDLEDLQRVYLAGRFLRYNSELDQQKRKQETLENQLARNAAQSGLQVAALAQARDQIQEVQTELSQAGHQADKARLRMEYLESRIADMEARERELQNEQEQAQEQITALVAEQKTLETRLVSFKEEHENRLQLLEYLQTEASQCEERYQVSNNRTMEIRNRLHELQRQQRTQVETVSQLQNQLTSVSEAIRRVTTRRDQLAADQADNARRVTASREELQEAQNRLEALSQQQEQGVAQLETISEQLAEFVEEKQVTINAVRNLDHELLSVTTRIDSLQEVVSRGEGLDSGVRAVLKAFGPDTPDETDFTVLGTIADLYETDDHHEIAVAAALHDHLENVVAPSNRAVKTITEFLAEAQYGPVVLLSADWHRVNSEPEISSNLNSIVADAVPLRSVVSAAPGLESIFDWLLHGVYLVPDHSIPVLQDEPVDGYCFVTPGGYRLGPGPRLMVPGVGDNKMAYRQRLAEIKTLTEKQSVLSRDTEDARERLQALESRGAELEGQRSSIAGQLAATQQEIAVANRDATHLASALARVQEQGQVMNGEVESIASELAALQTRLERLQLEHTEANRAADLHDEISAVEQELEDAQSHGEACRDTLMETRIRLNSTGDQVTSSTGEMGRMNDEIQRIGQMIERTRIQAERKVSIEASGRDERQEHVEELQQLVLRQPELKNSVENLRVRLSRMRDAEQALASEVSSLEKNERQIEREMGDIRVAVASVESSLASLKDESQWDLAELASELAVEFPEVPEPEELQQWKAQIEVLRNNLLMLGDVNLAAEEEHRELVERNQFLDEQIRDLEESIGSLRSTIQQINRASKVRFLEAYEVVNSHFGEVFQKLFSGGEASLQLLDPDDPLESGVDIVCKPPGKRARTIDLLSGGEKALAALSLLLAGFRYRPSPLLFLDEVDAPLDDANVVRFTEFLKELAKVTQVVMITHNATTMEAADVLYGITMEEPGISRLVSARLSML